LSVEYATCDIFGQTDSTSRFIGGILGCIEQCKVQRDNSPQLADVSWCEWT